MSDELYDAAVWVLASKADPEALTALEIAVLRRRVDVVNAENRTLGLENDSLRACVVELQGQVNTVRLDAIERLEARVAELTAEASRRETYIVELEGRLAHPVKPAATDDTVLDEMCPDCGQFECQCDLQEVVQPVPTPEACPHCGKTGFASIRQHINYCPKNPNRKPPANKWARERMAAAAQRPAGVRVVAASERPAAKLVDDNPDWRCEICRSDAHARDMHDPTRCVRCAQSFGRAA